MDGLIQPQRLEANGQTVVALSAPNPGDYTVALESGDTALLNVRPLGGR